MTVTCLAFSGVIADGVVVHKECKLRVRQPEFGGGRT